MNIVHLLITFQTIELHWRGQKSLNISKYILYLGVKDGIQDKDRDYLGGLFLSIGHIGKVVAPLIGGFLADYFFISYLSLFQL